MRRLYYALLAVAAIALLSICFLDLGIDRKSNVVIALLCFIFFVYEPIIKGYGRNILFGDFGRNSCLSNP